MHSQQWYARLASWYVAVWLGLIGVVAALSASCGGMPPAATPAMPTFAKQLVLYNWEGDLPQQVLDAFQQEYGIKIDYQTYESQEEAIANLRAGRVYDVVTMESRFIPLLVKEQLLAEVNYRNVPNFKNISPNFRDLVYDPDNRHAIPYNWGTTGLVVRSDLVQSPITRWADLWDPRYAGRVAIWSGQPREVIALTLKSLGYSANSVNSAELGAALAALLKLKPQVIFIEDFSLVDSSELLASGRAVIAMGYAGDVLASRKKNSNIAYILPDEGALVWGDTFVIPINSPNQSTAELFLNFILRPEVNAQIANENQYATPNQAARPFIDPDILSDPVIFPSNSALKNAELILPLDETGQKLYDDLWTQFMDGP